MKDNSVGCIYKSSSRQRQSHPSIPKVIIVSLTIQAGIWLDKRRIGPHLSACLQFDEEIAVPTCGGKAFICSYLCFVAQSNVELGNSIH